MTSEQADRLLYYVKGIWQAAWCIVGGMLIYFLREGGWLR